MELSQFLTALVGAFFGAFGWLLVGLFLTRRANERQARNAARAVYFELAMNEIDIDVAVKHGVFGTLRRSSFDRLLPELATWLEAHELEAIARAYMSHAGYEQTQREDKLPAQIRNAVLAKVQAEHDAASNLLRRRSFSAKEAARLSTMSRAEGAGHGANVPSTPRSG
ncbi:MAG: hypothetical protein ACR2H0_02090 [Candidatus Limnocylindrales bacterium]